MEIHTNPNTIGPLLTTYGSTILSNPSFAVYQPVGGNVLRFSSAAVPGVIFVIVDGGVPPSTITAIVPGATLAPVDDLR